MKSILPLSLCLAAALSACKPAGETGSPATDIPEQSSAAAAPEVTPVMPPEVPVAEVPVAEAQSLHYQCGDLLVSTSMQGDAMRLSFSGRDIVMPHIPSGSGAKYGDGKGNEFWSKGEEAMLMLGGKEVGNCTKSERASPWVDAQSRNIGFRAIGNEPGWYVEVGRGEAPALHAELDYGERKLDIASVTPLDAPVSGFRGTATDGTTAELRVTREPCNDGMSGEAFEASAELVVGDRTYKGCGAYLFD